MGGDWYDIVELPDRRTGIVVGDCVGTQVLAAVGEIDMSDAASFREALSRALAGDAQIVVDLTGVEYLDSAGLTVLFTHASHIELIATPLLAPVLTISGLAGLTHLHEIDPGADGNGPQ